jgi:hypothetical protein
MRSQKTVGRNRGIGCIGTKDGSLPKDNVFANHVTNGRVSPDSKGSLLQEPAKAQ